jgi:hypothetical protein
VHGRDADLVAVGAEVVESLEDAASASGGVLAADAGEGAGR